MALGHDSSKGLVLKAFEIAELLNSCLSPRPQASLSLPSQAVIHLYVSIIFFSLLLS
jgi:hypothetical protein